MAVLETYELIGQIVQLMDCNIYITGITQVGTSNKYTITTKNTKWLILQRAFNIGGTNYMITGIVPNTSFDIELEVGQTPPIVTSFTIPVPFYYHGTLMLIDSERAQEKRDGDNSPFVYFNEPSTDTEITDVTSNLDRESDCDIYFMVQADFENWRNEQHYLYCIKAAANMKAEFIKAAENFSLVVGELLRITSENHVKWGSYTQGNNTKNVFSEKSSGKKMQITIPFMKGCDECCDDHGYNPGDQITFNIYVDDVLQQSFTVPASQDNVININWT